MLRLGERQTLKINEKKEFGVYLVSNEGEEKVLLPIKQVPEGAGIGDDIEVFLYRDSNDRIIATTINPKITKGKVALLEVKEVSKIGAFLDWGLEKDLLLPFKEQTVKVKVDNDYLVALYLDKSERLCATMKIYNYLTTDAPYKAEDTVVGTVYNYNPEYGVFVAVDNKYHAMIQKKEVTKTLNIGDTVEARVLTVREDGKLDLSIRGKSYMQIDENAEKIYSVIEKLGGKLPYTDKAAPDLIRKDFSMSKNDFKKAVGRLLKEGRIVIGDNDIQIKK